MIAEDNSRVTAAEINAPIAKSGKKFLIFAAIAGLLMLAIFAAPRLFDSQTPNANNQTAV